MATAVTATPLKNGQYLYCWDLASGETGDPADVTAFPDKTVQISGTFNTGAILIEGSVHPTTAVYATLRDVPGNAISGKTAAYCEVIQQDVCLIRPVATTITAVRVCIKCGFRPPRLF